MERYLRNVLAIHSDFGIKASFFFPAEAARQLKRVVRELLAQGHRVGCHGLTHRREYFDVLPDMVQEERLRQATRELEDICGERITFFRGPAFKISGTTIRILEQLSYDADLSINSQRLGIFSSDVWNVGWMLAPRTPYHPDLQRPWRRGAAKLWEIPLSCVLFPFMISTALVFGRTFMRLLFRALYIESLRSRRLKPIVYMAHPEDLCEWRRPPARSEFKWGELVPTDQGFAIRRRLYVTEPEEVSYRARSVIDLLRSTPRLRFLTVPDYVRELAGAPG